MRTRPMVVAVVTGIVAAVLISAIVGARGGRLPQTGAELYDRLAQAAAAGDTSAAAYKQALDKHLHLAGLTVADLAIPTNRGSVQAHAGALQLHVTDNAPWGIEIDNRTLLDTPKAVKTYTAARSAAVVALAARDPDRQIEVVVAPADPLTPAQLAELLSCPCPTSQIIVDVFSEAGWLMSSIRQFGSADLAVLGADADAQFRDQISASLDLYPGVRPGDLRLEVRSARIEMRAHAANAALKLPEILLVDPLSDLSDTYVGRAAVVTVSNPPDVREAHRRVVMGTPIDAQFVAPEVTDQ